MDKDRGVTAVLAEQWFPTDLSMSPLVALWAAGHTWHLKCLYTFQLVAHGKTG